jgi:hypothetical protein
MTVLPFATQIKNAGAAIEADSPIEGEVIFCVQGVITAPCGVPARVSIRHPSSSTPAFSHLWIRRMIRRSPIRCSTNLISQSWLIVSNDRVS